MQPHDKGGGGRGYQGRPSTTDRNASTDGAFEFSYDLNEDLERLLALEDEGRFALLAWMGLV